MKDLNTEQTYTFKCNRWLYRQEEDMDVWRELPVINPGQEPLPGKVINLFCGVFATNSCSSLNGK